MTPEWSELAKMRSEAGYTDRSRVFARAIRSAPHTTEPLPSDSGFMKLASPAAVLTDAAILAGGESIFRWLFTTDNGLVGPTFFWEQSHTATLVTSTREAPLFHQHVSNSGWPFKVGVSGTHWTIPRIWAGMHGRGASLAAYQSISLRRPLDAVFESMAVGPCCLSLLFGNLGPRGRRGARHAWLTQPVLTRMALEARASRQNLYASIAHVNVGQVVPLSSSDRGFDALISIQIGSASRDKIDAYVGRDYDIKRFRNLFLQEYYHARSAR